MVEHVFEMSEAALVARIAVLERSKSAAAAEQARVTAELHRVPTTTAGRNTPPS